MMGLATIGSFLSSLASPIAKAYQAKQERKQAAETGNAKLKLADKQGENELKLKASEWEAMAKHNEAGSWKDEYVTVIITSPFVLLFFAAIVSGFTGDMRYLDAVNLGLESLKNLGVELGELLTIVVLAAVSIKGIGMIRR